MQTSKSSLQHRPLTPKELEGRTAAIDRVGECPAVQFSLDVTSAHTPEPKTAIRREGDHWRIEVSVPGAVGVRRTGLTATSLPLTPRAARTPHQLDGFLPKNSAVRVHPASEIIAAPKMHLRGPKKGNYEPLLVFPGDGRQVLTDTSWPWNLTGLVTNSDGFSGSGVLVGDRLMLTAHHLRPSRSIDSGGGWWMTFTPNFDSAAAPSAPFGASNVSDLRHYDADSDTDYVTGHDYMLCRLFEPLGQRLGYLGSTSFNDDWRGQQVWHNIGYPFDVAGGTRPAVQFNQSMEDDSEDDDGQILETEASLNHGNSGGPFFSWFTDGQVRLCSVVSAEFSFGGDRDNALAGGDDMVHLIDWGRSNWPV